MIQKKQCPQCGQLQGSRSDAEFKENHVDKIHSVHCEVDNCYLKFDTNEKMKIHAKFCRQYNSLLYAATYVNQQQKQILYETGNLIPLRVTYL